MAERKRDARTDRRAGWPPPRQILIKIREGHRVEQVADRSEVSLLYDGNPLQFLDPVLNGRRLLRQSFPRYLAARSTPSRGPRTRRSPYSLDLFLRLTLLDPDDDPRGVLRDVRRIAEVEFARMAARPSANPPTVPDYANPVTGDQGYLGLGAIGGIDARYAWGAPYGEPLATPPAASATGTGSSIDVVVIDQTFCDTHANIPEIAGSRVHGTLHGDQVHGAKVLGVLGAPHDRGDGEPGGTAGICRHATFHFSARRPAATALEAAAGTLPDVDHVKALDAVLPSLGPGSVILFEVTAELESYWTTSDSAFRSVSGGTTGDVPVEVDADTRTALSEAASDGITVIEVAGNTGGRLDVVEDSSDGSVVWDPGDTTDSSRAIVVGAGGREDRARSLGNYGSRVDCQAWGEGVRTPVCPEGDDAGAESDEDTANNEYQPDFGGTSAAAAIIAGLVASLQGAHKAFTGDPLDPDRIRLLLGTEALGSPQILESDQSPGDDPRHIGPLPNLYRILSHLGMFPELGMRSHLFDDGAPSPTLFNRSPDLILRNDLDLSVGPGSWMTEERSLPAGSDNRIYYRVRNRGHGPDAGRLRLFWSAPASFLHPAWWTPLTPTPRLPMIAPKRTHFRALVWSAPTDAAGRALALIGLLEPDRNRAPDVLMKPIAEIPSPPPRRAHLTEPLETVSTADFLAFARNHPDTAFRSVVWETQKGAGPVTFDYRFRGAPEGPAVFRLEVTTDLPPDTDVRIDCDTEITSVGAPGVTWGPPPIHGYKGPPLDGSLEFPLGRLEEVAFTIRVQPSPDTPAGNYETAIDQWIDAEHLGRCTLIVVVPE